MRPLGLSRVLVALGVANPDQPAMELGVGLAAAMGAALEALFVEDANLVRLGALPFASEISTLTGARRALAGGELERALRVETCRLEQLLAASAARQRVPWSFAVTRGELFGEAMARDADLTVVGAPRRPSARRQEPQSPGPVAALFDASPGALRALAAATRLAQALTRKLVILVPAGEGESHGEARKQAREWLAAQRVQGFVVSLAAAHAALADAMRTRRSSLLALPASELSAPPVSLPGLVAELTCPVLIVR